MGSGNMNSILTGLILLTSVALIEMDGKRGRHFLIETRDRNENGLDYHQSFTVRGKSRVLYHSKDATVFECHGTIKATCTREHCTALCEDGSNFTLHCPDGGFDSFDAIVNRTEKCKQHELTCKYLKTKDRCAA